MSLKKLLTLGFGVILGLILVISVVASFRFYQSSGGFNTYRGLALTSVSTGRVQANILEARLAALKYIQNHNPENIAALNERINTAISLIEEVLDSHIDDGHKSEFVSIENQLKQYKQGFNQVIETGQSAQSVGQRAVRSSRSQYEKVSNKYHESGSH